jgi:hypothetical protein
MTSTIHRLNVGAPQGEPGFDSNAAAMVLDEAWRRPGFVGGMYMRFETSFR